MLETGNDNIMKEGRLTIRVGQESLAFACKNDDGKIAYTPYKTKKGISMAANLREAMKDDSLRLGTWKKVQVLLDSPTIMVPIDEYDERNKEILYRYSVTGQENCAVLATILPTVNAVAIYSLNKDLRLVLTDNFSDIKIHPLCASLWQYLQRRNSGGTNEKLYAYSHDGKIELCSFRKSRFRFCNSFNASAANDEAYYILAAWQQLGMNAKKDDIFLIGDFNDVDKLTEALHKFVENVYRIKPSADFNRHPLTLVDGIQMDIVTTLLK